MTGLLNAMEMDHLLSLPRGRSVKMAKAGKLPYVLLPKGEIRFNAEEVLRHVENTMSVPVTVGASDDD